MDIGFKTGKNIFHDSLTNARGGSGGRSEFKNQKPLIHINAKTILKCGFWTILSGAVIVGTGAVIKATGPEKIWNGIVYSISGWGELIAKGSVDIFNSVLEPSWAKGMIPAYNYTIRLVNDNPATSVGIVAGLTAVFIGERYIIKKIKKRKNESEEVKEQRRQAKEQKKERRKGQNEKRKEKRKERWEKRREWIRKKYEFLADGFVKALGTAELGAAAIALATIAVIPTLLGLTVMAGDITHRAIKHHILKKKGKEKRIEQNKTCEKIENVLFNASDKLFSFVGKCLNTIEKLWFEKGE